MRFLIDASLPRAVSDVLLAAGHEGVDVRDVGLRKADDSIVAARAQTERIPLISADFDFADIRIYPPEQYDGLVVIDRPEDAPVVDVLKLVERFLAHHELLANLSGRLVIVAEIRIRVRPPLPNP